MQKYRILIFLTICAVFIISGCRNTGTGNDNKYPDKMMMMKQVPIRMNCLYIQ